MDKDNYVRLMQEAANQSAEKAKESYAFHHRQAFYDGMGFANKMRRDQTESLIKIRRLAKAALDGIDDGTINCLELCESLEKIMRLCTTPDGEGG